LMAASQAREQRVEVDLAADANGRVQALRARVVSDAGAYHIYPITGILEALGTANILPGPYLTPTYAFEAIALATHKPPLGAYRGVGMTMGAFVMERLLDLLAARVGLDPAEIRRRNVIPREAYPHVSPSGMRYDSGDFPKALEQALAAADYDGLRRGQAAARARGRLVGIGLACYTEYTGMGSEVFRGRGMDDVPGIEAASVRVDPDGSVRCATSFPSQGQGHATTIAQVIADRLGVPLERVRVEPTDTRSAPLGSGTFGSRGAVSIGGTVVAATERLRPKIQTLAAHLLEASAADVVLEDGHAHVRGFPQRAVTLADIARDATGQLVTGTLMDYALPTAGDAPSFEIGHLETPSPLMPGGIKGMGEGGTIGAPAAIANAVADAVAPLGIAITALPIVAEQLTRLPHHPRRKA